MSKTETRVRTKTKPCRTFSKTGTGPIGQSYKVWQSVMVPIPETMTDVIGGDWPKAKRDRPLFRKCNVTGLTMLLATEWALPLNKATITTSAVGTSFSEAKVTQTKEGYLVYPMTERQTQAPQSRIDRGVSEAVRAMRLGLNGELAKGPKQNLLRAWLELKDTGQTMDNLVTFTYWFMDQIKQRSWGRKAQRLHPMMSVAAVAKAYLTWKFGVEPTVQELNQFRHDLDRNEYFAVSGRPTKLRMENSIETSSWRVPSFGDRYDPAKGRPLQKGVICTTPWLTLSTRVGWIQAGTPYFNPSTDVGSWNLRPLGLPFLTGMNAVAAYVNPKWGTEYRGVVFGRRRVGWLRDELTVLKTRLQWRNPLFKSAWENVPMSFIVDWFLETGRGIEEIDHALLAYKYRDDIDDIWLTAKATPIVWVPNVEHSLEVKIDRRSFVQSRKTYEYGQVKVRGIWTIKDYTQTWKGANFSFLRMPLNEYNAKYSSGFSTPIVNVPVKSYQLSSGLAMAFAAYRRQR